MNFLSCVADMKDKRQDPKEVAKIVFNFFLWQYEQAVREEIAARHEHSAAGAANDAAKAEYDRDESICGWGGYKLPYQEGTLDNLKTQAGKKEIDRQDAKVLLDFVRDQLLDKFECKPPLKKSDTKPQ